MKKSSLLMTVPNGVLTAMRPDPVPGGTSVSMVVVVAELRMARTRLNIALLLASVGVKVRPGDGHCGTGNANGWTECGNGRCFRSGGHGEGSGARGRTGRCGDRDRSRCSPGRHSRDDPCGGAEITVAEMPLNVTVFSPGVVAETRAMYSH